MHKFYSCHHGHFSWSHRVMTRKRGWLIPTEWVILSTWLFLCWGYPLWSSYRCNYLHYFPPYRDIYWHTSFPNFIVTSFPFVFLPSPWPSSQTQPINWYIIAHLTNSLSKQGEQTCALLEVRFPFTTVLQECPKKGAIILQLSSFRWYLHLVQNHL